MEKQTSKIFKKWMTNDDVCRSVYKGPLAQGTAEDRVTAVNNELARTSLTKCVTVFDDAGQVVHDLRAMLLHLKAIKISLDGGHYLEQRNKYGIGSFVDFVKWLVRNPKLDAVAKIEDALENLDWVDSLPYGKSFKAYLVRKYGMMTGNAISIVCRVKRILRMAPHTHGKPTRDELESMIRNMGRYVENPDSSANCKTAIRHYMKVVEN